MKQPETSSRIPRTHLAVMTLCFLYAGFSLLLFLLQSYSLFWRTEFFPFPSEIRFLTQGRGIPGFDADRPALDPIGQLLSPFSLLTLFGGIVALLAGTTIWKITHEKEIKKIRQETTDSLLLPEEKTLIDCLKKSGFESTQSTIVRETGLTKVQVHRIIYRLSTKGILEKHPYGVTNKIILKKELFE